MRRRYLRLLFASMCLLIMIPSAFAQEEVASASETTYGISPNEIRAYAGPEVETLTVDVDLLHDRRYQRIEQRVDIFDAPGGNIVRSLDAGFNFVTVGEVREDGWTQINENEWIRSEFAKDSNWVVSQFTGFLLPDEMPEYPIAWALTNLYVSSYPGGPALETNELLYRYTPVNIFAEYELDGWKWYQVGVDQWVQQTNVAKVIPVERPADVDTHKWVSVDLYEQVMIAYEGTKPVFTTLIASGLPRWETLEGVFNIYYRRTREYMSWGTPGDDFYALEEVPWTMYFDEGRALHGAYWHDGFGFRRSHGCVNLPITDAYWLYHWVAEDFEGKLNSPDREVGPAVYVYHSGEYV
jgi:lipoprotein-anchoring transpeptidase ErfK/SrfK